MDSTGFAGLASALAGRYTVVTYDPRGIGNSTREDTGQDVTPEQQADDVHRLLSRSAAHRRTCSAAAAGQSWGSRWSPPTPTKCGRWSRTNLRWSSCCPTAQLRAEIQDIYDTWRADGADKAMGKFMAHAAWTAYRRGSRRTTLGTLAGADRPDARHHRVFLAHLIRPTTRYRPDIAALRAAPTRIVVAAGATPGHLALFREANRVLIAGNAVLTVNLNSPGDALSQRHTLGGPPRVATWNWRAATGSVSELARLEPGVLVPGHGRPMAGPVLAPALRALGEQLGNPASAGSAGSSAGRKLMERVLNFFDYSRRAR